MQDITLWEIRGHDGGTAWTSFTETSDIGWAMRPVMDLMQTTGAMQISMEGYVSPTGKQSPDGQVTIRRAFRMEDLQYTLERHHDRHTRIAMMAPFDAWRTDPEIAYHEDAASACLEGAQALAFGLPINVRD